MSHDRAIVRVICLTPSEAKFLITTNAGDPAADGGLPLAAVNALTTRLQVFWQTGR